MLGWFLANWFMWAVRLGILVVGCVSMQHILHDQLGYRADLNTMLVSALLIIITVRLWMPWSTTKRRDDGVD